MKQCSQSRKEAVRPTPLLTPRTTTKIATWNIRTMFGKTVQKENIKLNIIQCYAPTNDTIEEKKDDFYDQLQGVLDRLRTKDVTILMGDFNAKTGAENNGYEDIMGTHGLGQMNENGERFADLCSLNQLVIGGRIFPNKRIHKATWRSPDHVTENQIDHLCISRKFRRSCQDVRVMRGADAASDHHLLLMTAKIRLKRHSTTRNTITRYDLRLLRNQEVEKSFQISLRNRYQILQEQSEDMDGDIETQWQQSKKMWLDT
ncbi:hypothetical protein SKAU_G00234120 [Synaphobranchus kaupii]|uniref:Endonuclease/exonuclease/phosphatase domain-containing protein n=1 Tax=Synaphobranchus kaupii TaxID=118154 RepID=A0A9Q1F6N3_SYNKA|nr:hypothetical protein SKAU_G00234120 [Synaphobranchus kaupii]